MRLATMPLRFLILGFVIAGTLVASPAGAAGQDHPIWGRLEPGPHPVGVMVEYRRDPARVDLPEERPDGTPETRPIARLMQVALWYPARPNATGTPMSLGDYIDLQESGLIQDDRREEGVLTDEQRAELVDVWATYGIMTGVVREAWERLLTVRMRAVPEAPPAAGPFPLILIAPGASGSIADLMGTAEYLASHGYVVASTPSRGRDLVFTRVSSNPRLTESNLEDAEYAIGRAAARDFVNVRELGVLGMSRGGMAALLLGMRNPSIDAIVMFDSGLGRLTTESPSFEPGRMTAPVLMFRTGAPRTLFPLDSLRYADVHYAWVAGIHHIDFSALGMIHTALGVRNQYITSSDEHIRTAHEWVNRYTLLFMDAHVKKDEHAAARLADAMDAPPEMIRFTAQPGRPAPPASSYLAELVWRRGGIAEAAGLIRVARVSDPEWMPFPEAFLNASAYRFMELGRHAEALGMARLNVELFPSSANAHDSLAEFLMRTGDRTGAIRHYERSLELDPANENAREMLRSLNAPEAET